MKLLVRHQTSYAYESGSSRAVMLLKLMPRSNGMQKVHEWQVFVNDQPVLNFAPNGYGDLEALWIRHDRMAQATIVATGIVETIDTAGVIAGLNEHFDPRIFLRETDLTQCPAELRAFAAAVVQGAETPLARLHALSSAVRDHIDYRAGVTGPDTRAAEAFALGAGVCQDHAQVFITAARCVGIPARYVTGYLLARGGDDLHETHGWAEAYVPGLGWIGFDASNRVCVTEDYVRVAAGLDAHDAAPVRGSVMAAGTIWIDADVRIAQASEDEREQQLQRQQQQVQIMDRGQGRVAPDET